MLADLTFEELSAGFDDIVDEILDQCRCTQPPVDAFRIAESLGITVALDDCQTGRARYVRLRDRSAAQSRAAILLRSDPRLERQQWAVAHEIGEHAAYRAFHRLGVDPRESPPNAREQVANRLAGRLLIPTCWFGRDAAACNWDLLALKHRYRTASHELIARRMLEFRPAVIITIFDQGRITFRRGNLPGRIPPPTSTEWSCWRLVHENNEAHATTDGLCPIQCWPVHEDDWKREIIRFELTNEEAYCM
jgi:hypothetical protein